MTAPSVASPGAPPVHPRRAIRAVAFLEAFKGVIVLLAASGLVSLAHQDLADFALRLVEHAHLNPAAKYPGIFIEAAGHLQDSGLVWLALGAAAYALLRLAEAYGLFHEKVWAEVLAAASGAIYVPIELLELSRRPTWLGALILLVNLAIVLVMVRALRGRREMS